MIHNEHGYYFIFFLFYIIFLFAAIGTNKKSLKSIYARDYMCENGRLYEKKIRQYKKASSN